MKIVINDSIERPNYSVEPTELWAKLQSGFDSGEVAISFRYLFDLFPNQADVDEYIDLMEKDSMLKISRQDANILKQVLIAYQVRLGDVKAELSETSVQLNDNKNITDDALESAKNTVMNLAEGSAQFDTLKVTTENLVAALERKRAAYERAIAKVLPFLDENQEPKVAKERQLSREVKDRLFYELKLNSEHTDTEGSKKIDWDDVRNSFEQNPSLHTVLHKMMTQQYGPALLSDGSNERSYAVVATDNSHLMTYPEAEDLFNKIGAIIVGEMEYNAFMKSFASDSDNRDTWIRTSEYEKGKNGGKVMVGYVSAQGSAKLAILTPDKKAVARAMFYVPKNMPVQK